MTPLSSRESRATTIGRLTGLLEVTRLVRSEGDLAALLPAIAQTVAESLGFGTVAVSVYRPAWDDFRVEAVHGSGDVRELLLHQQRTWEEWEPLLDPVFERHGCYLLPWDEFDWSQDRSVSYVPRFAPSDAPNAWHPEDALFVPLRHAEGHLLGVMSVDEPVSGQRPSDEDLRVLAALADHAAQAIQDAQAAAEAVRHGTALEHLLRVSARLTEMVSMEAVLQSVCEAIRAVLGFHNVSVELIDAGARRAVPKAVIGWTLEQIEGSQSSDVAVLEQLLDPAFEVEGCYLLPNDEGCRRLGIERPAFQSARNGRGPNAWDHHWLLIPLRDRAGALSGVIWADEPEDLLLPSRQRLQALRMFANQATTAVASAAQFEEVQFLADHDPLTRVGNRRAFTRRLAEEVTRAARYGGRFALVVLDVDGFKALNDRHGHHVGDRALEQIGEALRQAVRSSDSAFRLGGDEFAVLLEHTGPEEAARVVDRVGAGIAAVDAGADTLLRASFGVAVGDGSVVDPDALLRAADAAMYAAKRAGEGVRFAALEAAG
jgi:diguanylate cyclase (GGDEF)-like protein